MIRTYSLLVILFLVASLSVRGQQQIRVSTAQVVPEQWILQRFKKGIVPPFSFIYNGKASSGFISRWKHGIQKIKRRESDVAYSITYQDPVTGLKVTCEIMGFTDFNTVDWTLHFSNTGTSSTPAIKDVKAADLSFSDATGGLFKLYYADGNHISKADFHPRSVAFRQRQVLHMEPVGGRSSQGNYLPFFNMEFPSGQGVVASVGWTGNWVADIGTGNPGCLQFATGMKNMELFLYPRESIRTPRVSLLFWKGTDRMDGHNKFRRMVMKHYTQKINGAMAKYPLSAGFNYKDPAPCTEYSCLTEEYAIAMMRRYEQFKLLPEVFWLDAGWNTGASNYEQGQTWANTVGNWTVDTTRFHDGLRPIAREAHRLGAKFMVWFEPERVIRGTDWATRNPQWMLDIPGASAGTYLLFDLGNPEANKWLREYIGDMIEKNQIDYYRQDFNMEPDIYWAANEAPGRKGIKEIRHVEGLYAFWDYLLDRFPGLLIDNCASGGKRIDLETICRSAPLWRSDYYHYDDPDGYQSHAFGLNYFLPFHGTGVQQTDPYAFRSSLGTALIYNWKITTREQSITEMQRCLEEFNEVRPYYYEDYYPLTTTENTTSDSIWLAYQLHRPSDKTGVVLAFRRSKAQDSSIIVRLSGLDKTKNYRIEDKDTKAAVVKPGAELSDGLKLTISKPHQSLLLKYSVQ